MGCARRSAPLFRRSAGAASFRTVVLSCLLYTSINKLGYRQMNAQYFDTLRFALPDNVSAQQVRTVALSKEVNLRYFKNGDVGMSIDETTDLAAVNVLPVSYTHLRSSIYCSFYINFRGLLL